MQIAYMGNCSRAGDPDDAGRREGDLAKADEMTRTVNPPVTIGPDVIPLIFTPHSKRPRITTPYVFLHVLFLGILIAHDLGSHVEETDSRSRDQFPSSGHLIRKSGVFPHPQLQRNQGRKERATHSKPQLTDGRKLHSCSLARHPPDARKGRELDSPRRMSTRSSPA